MTRILHVVDSSASWEVQTALGQLQNRLPDDRFAQHLITLSGATTSAVGPSEKLPWLASIPWLGGPSIRSTARRFSADIVHAWGVDAAIAAASCEVPLVIQMHDPDISARDMKALRTLDQSTRLGIACTSGMVRRRLIEGGIPAGHCALVRPGVDFAWLGRQSRRDLRRQIGLAETDYAVLVTEPATRSGGHMETSFACELASFVSPRIRMILPGRSREHARIRRFFSDQPHPEVMICPDPVMPFLQLLPAADVLVVAPFKAIPTSAIAWAMAAGVGIIGVADYAVAELITHKVNGSLFKPVRGEGRAVTLAKILAQEPSHAAQREAARGQAYEVFSLRRCIDQQTRLYENLRAGIAADAGISDAAALT